MCVIIFIGFCFLAEVPFFFADFFFAGGGYALHLFFPSSRPPVPCNSLLSFTTFTSSNTSCSALCRPLDRPDLRRRLLRFLRFLSRRLSRRFLRFLRLGLLRGLFDTAGKVIAGKVIEVTTSSLKVIKRRKPFVSFKMRIGVWRHVSLYVSKYFFPHRYNPGSRRSTAIRRGGLSLFCMAI